MKLLFTVLAIWAGCLGSPAGALDPARGIGQYKQSRWTVDDGVPPSIRALAQGASGFLWIGSSAGLFRFDGIAFEPIRPGKRSDNRGVSTIRVLRNGEVWVGYQEGGTSVFRAGVLQDVPAPEDIFVEDIVETPDGSVWATLGCAERQLLRLQNGRWREVSTEFGFPREEPAKMIAARDGTIWATTSKSVLFLRSGKSRFEHIHETLTGHASLSEDRQGHIWLSDASGSRTVTADGARTGAGKAVRYPSPTAKRSVGTLFDRDGNLWGRTEQGVFRVRSPQAKGAASPSDAARAVTRFGQKDGLLSNGVTALLEDQEGNIWVGTALGLERFRAARIVAEPLLTKPAFFGDVLLGAADGTVYVGEADAVYRVRPGGKPEVLLGGQEAQALCEGSDGTIWIVLQNRVVRLKNRTFTNIPAPPTGEHEIYGCGVDHSGKLWLAANIHGLYGRTGGRWRATLVPSPQDFYPPKELVRRRDGRLIALFVTQSLASIDPPGSAKSLLLPDSIGKIRSAYDTGDGLLVGGLFGLGLIRDGHVHILSSERFPAFRSVAGMIQSTSGRTWMSSSAGVVVVSTASLMRAFTDPHRPLVPTVLDYRDGLAGVQSRDTDRALVRGGDGRLWFATGAGTVWIDPARLSRNSQAPPVAIGAITTAGARYLDRSRLELRAGTSNIEIDFAAPSLSIPERVRILYKLEGADHGWIDPGRRRQAFYTNLGAGHYVFRVIAANEDGVWNRQGATLELDIPPTFLQSRWFGVLCMVGLAVLLWGAYLLRVGQLTAKMREKLEERLAERERIARDLHDTLLQSFQGLILRFQSVANAIPEDQRARMLIEQALDSADAVLNEGRDSVRHLRAVDAGDLPQAFADTAERMRHDYPIMFSITVEGTPRPLHPMVREEVCRIGDEALINAFRHSKGKSIELAISYQSSRLLIDVRDDGVGIDPAIFTSGGRQGHFGLVGMRERADQIGAELDVSSRPGSGTVIQVAVLASIAYAEKRRSVRGQRLRRLVAREV